MKPSLSWHAICFLFFMIHRTHTRPRARSLLAAEFLLAGAFMIPIASADPAGTEEVGLLGRAALEAVLARAAPAGLHLDVTPDRMDPRLRLPRCESALRADIAGDGQLHDHATVAVHCETPVHWTVYVGVAIDTEMTVLVARRPLARDAVPVPEDFASVTRRVPGVATRYADGPAALEGQRLRRSLALGEALTLDALASLPVIRRGAPVTLRSGRAGFEVRVSATALADAGVSERVRVQNRSSDRIVEGIVRADGTVEVD